MKGLPDAPVATLGGFAGINAEAVAAALEADAGRPLPGIRKALRQAKRGEFGRVTTPEQALMREARRVTGLSQAEFARRIATPVTTLRGWEQGRFFPPGTATALARLIARHPDWAGDLMA